jgi:DNA mismatch endonuclease (patch repair protein)
MPGRWVACRFAVRGALSFSLMAERPKVRERNQGRSRDDRGSTAPSKETSARMRRIRRENTTPELAVRRVVTALGVRYRTCVRDLPGSPDLANKRAGWALFVHGCFWHAHSFCRAATLPKTNRPFWIGKLAANRARDAAKCRLLRRAGFRVVTVWQCELRDPENLAKKLRRALFGH